MTLAFERIRAKNGPAVEEAMQEWLAATAVDAVENVTVHTDDSGYIVYSVFYRE